MKTLISTMFSLVLVLSATLAYSAEVSFDQARYSADMAAGKPIAVVFHADWCPTCRAQAPVLKSLSDQAEFAPVTVYVADYDAEKALKKTLRVTQQSTIVIFKNGKERVRSTGETRQENLAALLRQAIS